MKRKKNVVAGILISLILMSIIFLIDSNGLTNIIGNVVYEGNTELKPQTHFELPIIANEKTSHGLVLRYGQLKQGIIEIGQPVKWVQEIRILNPTEDVIESVVVSFETPHDSKNHKINIGGEIEDAALLHIKTILPNEEISLMLSFETSPVMIEILEDGNAILDWRDLVSPSKETINNIVKGRAKQLRVWHDSSMAYHNIVIKMDLLLGEKLLKKVQGSEENLEFDYDQGKAIWLIKEL